MYFYYQKTIYWEIRYKRAFLTRFHTIFWRGLIPVTRDPFLVNIDKYRTGESEQRSIIREGPDLSASAFEFFMNSFQKICSPDLFPELRRKSTIIHQPLMEPVNSISCTRETPVIELNCVFLQSTGITQRFFQGLGNLFVIFPGDFSKNCTDEVE